MTQLGFSNEWITWTMALNNEAEAVITINGEQGQSFKLERSIRQRCLLAPYLFLFAATLLEYVLDDPKHNIEGLILSNQTSHTNSMFADDTSLFLKREPNNMQQTLRVLDTYYEAFRAKINWHKTPTIWVSQKTRTFNWRNVHGLT